MSFQPLFNSLLAVDVVVAGALFTLLTAFAVSIAGLVRSALAGARHDR